MGDGDGANRVIHLVNSGNLQFEIREERICVGWERWLISIPMTSEGHTPPAPRPTGLRRDATGSNNQHAVGCFAARHTGEGLPPVRQMSGSCERASQGCGLLLQSLAVGYLDCSAERVEAISACWVNRSWTCSLRRGAYWIYPNAHYDLRFLGEIPDVTVQPASGVHHMGQGQGWAGYRRLRERYRTRFPDILGEPGLWNHESLYSS